MNLSRFIHGLLAAMLLLGLAASPGQAIPLPTLAPVEALGTAFTYQGYLADNGSPANGLYDFRFSLYSVSTGGSAIAGPLNVDDVTVSHGYFTVQLDFGASPFAGEKRWLEIAAKRDADASYTTFPTRQELTATPYALYARTAPWSGLSGVPAGFADNIDNDTTYTAGSGLTLSGGNQFSADTTYLQRRLVGSCRVGSTIREVLADGSLVCWDDAPLNRPVPPNGVFLANTVATQLGRVNVATIGADGLPLILYSDTNLLRYFILHCNDPVCSTYHQTRIDDFTLTNDYASLAIDPSGLAVVSYYEPTNGDLYFGRCTDVACTSIITNTLFASPQFLGYENDITIATDGLPLVVFANFGPPRMLMTAHCNDAQCVNPPAIGIVDQHPNLINPDPSITLGADGRGLIAYHFAPSADLRVAHCNDPHCLAATLTTYLTGVPDGFQASITTGVDGLGLITYMDNASWNLWTAHCSDALCSNATLTPIYSLMAGNFNPQPNITIGAFGLGIISFFDMPQGFNTIMVANCNNPPCSSATFYPAALNTGWPSWITITPSGNPLITYPDIGFTTLIAQFCSSPFCVPFYRRR